MNVADRLAEIRNRLASLESRAANRRARDAELSAEPTPAPKAPAKPGRKRAEDEPAMHGRDWLSEARADLARVDAAPRTSTRRERPSVAPEYASSVDHPQQEPTENRTEPGTQPGGNADGAAAGNPEDSQRRGNEGAATGRAEAAPDVALAGQGAKKPGTYLELRDGSPQPAAVPATPEALNSERVKNRLSASGVATHGMTFDPLAPTRPEADPRPAAVAGCGPPKRAYPMRCIRAP